MFSVVIVLSEMKTDYHFADPLMWTDRIVQDMVGSLGLPSSSIAKTVYLALEI